MLKAITQAELKIKLDLHLKWLHGETGGERADLRYADLSSADLSYADLSYADLRSANLRSADLRYADLRYADLSSADLRYADLPSPTMLLLASWYRISAELTLKLMRYDAANHPEPSKFDEWAKGGECPYADVKWQRCANFHENRELWKPGKTTKSALELVMMLFAEKEIKR